MKDHVTVKISHDTRDAIKIEAVRAKVRMYDLIDLALRHVAAQLASGTAPADLVRQVAALRHARTNA